MYPKTSGVIVMNSMSTILQDTVSKIGSYPDYDLHGTGEERGWGKNVKLLLNKSRCSGMFWLSSQ